MLHTSFRVQWMATCLVEGVCPTGSGGILPPSETCGAAAMPSNRLAMFDGFFGLSRLRRRPFDGGKMHAAPSGVVRSCLS